jgi:Cys-tRNA(Pro)/Cys-tRNA(Cys) deacylase
MNILPPVSLALTEMGIAHQVFEHNQPPRTFEQAAEERGQRPEQVVRSILFRVSQGEGEFVMVLMAGPGQINWKSLRNYLGVSRISMASKEEVFKITGYELGAVAPFGLSAPIQVMVDESVLHEDVISLGSGIRGVAVVMKARDLISALGGIEILPLGK